MICIIAFQLRITQLRQKEGERYPGGLGVMLEGQNLHGRLVGSHHVDGGGSLPQVVNVDLPSSGPHGKRSPITGYVYGC